MRPFPIALAAFAAALLASCASRPTAAPPPQPVRPAPARPEPVQTPPPAPVDWADSALSPGEWTYSGDGFAAFGPAGRPSFTIRCEPSRQVSLSRTGAATSTALTVRTSSTARTLPARSSAGALAATLAASDPFLDAMAFSRGRFTVETPGVPALVVPAWPEAARVVEDCRS